MRQVCLSSRPLPRWHSASADCVNSRQPPEAPRRRRRRRRRRKWWRSSTVCRAPRKSPGYETLPASVTRPTQLGEMFPPPYSPTVSTLYSRAPNRASSWSVWRPPRRRGLVRWGEARWVSPTQITSRWCWTCPRSRASRSPTSTSVRKFIYYLKMYLTEEHESKKFQSVLKVLTIKCILIQFYSFLDFNFRL